MDALGAATATAVNSMLSIERRFAASARRLATGAASPEDNPSNHALATSLGTRLSTFDIGEMNAALANGALSTAQGALASISSTITKMASIASQAMSADPATRDALAAQYDSLRGQIDGYAADASLNGASLVSATPSTLSVDATGGGAPTLTVKGVASDSASLGLTTAGASWAGPGGTAAIQSSLDAAQKAAAIASQTAAGFAAAQSSLGATSAYDAATAQADQAEVSSLIGGAPAQELVNMKLLATQYQAAAAVVRTSDDMRKRLVSLFA
jgi:flagellin